MTDRQEKKIVGTTLLRILKCTSLLVSLLLLLSTGCRRDRSPVQSTWMSMGTFCSVSVPRKDQDLLREYAVRAEAITQEVNDRLTVYTNTSEISQLNQQAGQKPVPVSELTRTMLLLSKEYAQETAGAFEITVGPLVTAWGFNTGTTPSNILEDTALETALERIGHEYIQVGKETAFLSRSGAEVDLGGIAKGYAVDLCYDALNDAAPGGIMINIGGNLRCGGRARPGAAWVVGVRDPLQPDALLGSMAMTDGMAIATSGNYERFVEIDGERYAHILDPRTGHPVKGMAGVTVMSASATRADALSTALFVLGPEESKPILKKYPDVEALFVPDSQPIRILVTPGFAEIFQPLPAYTDAVEILEM